jgi:hypothetical protein
MNMNHDEEIPDFLGGLGDMLPADVLKKVNELLEQLHQKDKDHQGSTVFIYAPGSQYVDKQFIFDKVTWKHPAPPDGHHAPPRGGEPPKRPFDDRTPLSALFWKSHHEELEKVLNTWLPYLAGETEEVLRLNDFQFDFSKTQPATVYLDLARLINHGALQTSMSVLAAYMFSHSNLSKSENALYVQLKRYKKICK